MSNDEKKEICQNCEKFIPVIHLDVCSESMKLIAVALEENICPLSKWDNGNQL